MYVYIYIYIYIYILYIYVVSTFRWFLEEDKRINPNTLIFVSELLIFLGAHTVQYTLYTVYIHLNI